MNKICLIADIVDSRTIAERRESQDNLNKCLDILNTKRVTTISSPYIITLGDEFQAVYRDFSTIFLDILEILYTCYPLKIRFALGYGPLTTRENPVAAIGMDGPGFYFARDLLESLKSKKCSVIGLRTKEPSRTKLAEASLSAISCLIDSWNGTSLGCCAYLMQGFSPKGIHQIIGPNLGISEKTVYKALQSHNIAIIADYFTALAIELGDIE